MTANGDEPAACGKAQEPPPCNRDKALAAHGRALEFDPGRAQVCARRAAAWQDGDTVRRNFQAWILKRHSGPGQKFTEEQVEWLRMVRDHIASSIHIERDDLDMAPFDAKGGLGKMYQLFGNQIDSVLGELNGALAA